VPETLTAHYIEPEVLLKAWYYPLFSKPITPQTPTSSTLSLFVLFLTANHVHHTLAAYNFAVTADLFN
jgi:hypothetical protein